jgi:peptidylamidoglycolate lyase
MNRRLFVMGLPAMAAPVLIGHGAFRYRVDTAWSKADPAKYPVNDCHEMIQAPDGRLFMLTNHKQNNMLVYDVSGKLLSAWTLGFGGAHGLSIHKEFLYITDTGTGRVVKTTLDGEIVLELPHATQCGAYKPNDVYSPTETAVGPNGDIYVADGYGSQYILRYDAAGKYVGKFGGKSSQPINKGKFLQAHGVAIDARGATPLVVCTARIRNEFAWFTLDGQHVKTVYLPGAYMSRPVISGRHLYSGVCFGMFADDYRMWQNRGFVTILDDQDRVVSNPGGMAPVYKGDRLQVMLQDQPVFKNCHDVCVDTRGDLYVCQWNSGRVYPYKLHREA